MNSSRRIAHLDMDAFFASVELLRYPQLRGRAVVVGGRATNQPVEQADGSLRFARLADYAGRGVATTATYEARALGVFSAMGLMKAAQLAPDAVLLPAHFDAYRHASRTFKAAVAAIAPRIEDRGIDEIYLDLSAIDEETQVLARRIKQAVFAATGLSCSIGVAPNKLLAKICSDLDKPDGLTVLAMDEIATRIWPLPAKTINGIGPKSAGKLTGLNIVTIGDLATASSALLVGEFGATTALWMQRVANGIDERPLVTDSEPKSISRERTFERDLHARHDRSQLGEIFTALCQRVAADLQRQGYASRTIGVKLRYADFRSLTRDVSLPLGTSDAMTIRKAAGSCLKRIPLTQKIRLLGVRASALSAAGQCHPEASGRQAELPF